jgi:hypothetical protein
MLAKFKTKSGALLEFILPVKGACYIAHSKDFNWELIGIKVSLCKPIKCVRCNKIVATKHEKFTNVRTEFLVLPNGATCIDCCKDNEIPDDNPYDRSP